MKSSSCVVNWWSCIWYSVWPCTVCYHTVCTLGFTTWITQSKIALQSKIADTNCGSVSNFRLTPCKRYRSPCPLPSCCSVEAHVQPSQAYMYLYLYQSCVCLCICWEGSKINCVILLARMCESWLEILLKPWGCLSNQADRQGHLVEDDLTATYWYLLLISILEISIPMWWYNHWYVYQFPDLVAITVN